MGIALAMVLPAILICVGAWGAVTDLSLPDGAEVEKPFVVNVSLPPGLASPALAAYDSKAVQFFGTVVPTSEVQIVAEGRIEIRPEGGRPGAFGLRFLPLPGMMAASFSLALGTEVLERAMTLHAVQQHGGYSFIILGVGVLLLVLGWKLWQVQKKHPALMSTRSLFLNYEALEKLRQDYFPGTPTEVKNTKIPADSPKANQIPQKSTVPTVVHTASPMEPPTAIDPAPESEPPKTAGGPVATIIMEGAQKPVAPVKTLVGGSPATEVFSVSPEGKEAQPEIQGGSAGRSPGFTEPVTPVDATRNSAQGATRNTAHVPSAPKKKPHSGIEDAPPVPLAGLAGHSQPTKKVPAAEPLAAGALFARIQDDRGREFSGSGVEIGIGRKKDNAIVLTGAEVSRNHVVIKKDGDGFLVVVLSASNLTAVNGTRITKAAPIKVGDELALGGTIYKVLELRQG